MQKIDIKVPKWRPEPSVGISEKYQDDMEITISFKKANGEQPYPHTYFISWDRLMYFIPVQFKYNMPKVRIVPITMLEIKK